MSDKSFTFFELHFHDGFQLGPKTLGQGEQPFDDAAADETDAEVEAEPDTADTESSGGCLGCKLVGLGVLAAAAYAVRKLLSGPSGLDALDDIEELDEFGNGGSQESDEGDETDTDEGDGVAIEVTSGEEPDSGSNTGLLVAAAVTLLLLLAVAAKKLLGGDVEDIEIPDELAEE